MPIRVQVTVKGDEMTVDLTDVSRQVRGFYNSGITTGHACAQVAYKCITSPTDYPINDGSFRSLKIDRAARPGGERDAAGADALVDDLPDDDRRHDLQGAGTRRSPTASSPATMPTCWSPPATASTRSRSEFFIANFGPLGGGWGAKHNEDGVSATVCINDGDTHNSPNEQAEAKFPLVVENYRLVPDSGGPGRHRGGLGVERTVRARTNVTMNTQIERAHCRPWGLEGGLEGTGNAVALRLGGAWKTDFPNAKVLVAQLKPGDAFRIRAGRRRRLRLAAGAPAAPTSPRTCARATCRSPPRRSSTAW